MPRRRDRPSQRIAVLVPEEEYLLIQQWVNSGQAPYVNVDEAYRDAIRDILFKK